MLIQSLPPGETEWAKSGRQTGKSDIPLTPKGVEQVASTASHLVGAGKLLDPAKVVRVFVSPRRRAMQTFEQLCAGSTSPGTTTMATTDAVFAPEMVTVTEDIAEWDYGDYEGITEGETRVLRKERGLDVERKWDVWRDGCEGGE